MNSVNKTLYIPLYGKALVSRRGLLLADPRAEEIWAARGFPLKGKSASKWLAYTMAMRAAVFDGWLRSRLTSGAAVLHLGCGLDSRCARVSCDNPWYDVDFPAVVEARRQHFSETEQYHMLGCDLREDWLRQIPRGGTAMVVMEGISMYLSGGELRQLLKAIAAHFDHVFLLMDAYTVFGARASRFKNPINDVGVTEVFGFDDPREPAQDTGFVFLRELDMTPEAMIRALPKKEQGIFRMLFAGKTAGRFYRMYEYEAGR